MQPSQSLTSALATAEILLRADTDDLRELAALAGEDPRSMYIGADLSGVDLRNQDVGFLVGLGTNFEGAILTDAQRRRLRQGVRTHEKTETTRRSIRQARIDLVLKFIERHADHDIKAASGDEEKSIPHDWESDVQRSMLADQRNVRRAAFVANLRDALLDPITNSKSNKPADQFGSDYMSSALAKLSKYLSPEAFDFFENLFGLFGAIQCPIDPAVATILGKSYQEKLGPKISHLLARLGPTRPLDVWWILDQNGFNAMVDAAIKLSRHREIHSAVIEAFAEPPTSLEPLLQMLTGTQYSLGPDQAERVAYLIVSRSWPPGMTSSVLAADIPSPLTRAIFRQILAQGDPARVSEVVRWLDQNRGAVGALSLENALSSITDFLIVHQLAVKIAPNLNENQLRVLSRRLSELERTDDEKGKTSRFRQMYL